MIVHIKNSLYIEFQLLFLHFELFLYIRKAL